jgi:single-strand DNA-binding protein
MLNRCTFIGRLTSDGTLRYTPSGVATYSFTIAVDRNFKNSNGERDTDFIQVIAYRQLAELGANFLSKGKLCCVDGRLQIRSYEKDGVKHWVSEIIADTIQFLSPKDNSYGTESDESTPF